MRGISLLFALFLSAFAVTGAFLGNMLIPGGWPAAVSIAAAAVSGEASCTLGGVTVPSGGSKTFFLVPSVPSGDTCASIGVTRTCTNSTLSGTSTYAYPSCFTDASLSNIRTGLKAFLPYVRSVAWYPWFNNTVGTDSTNRGLALFTLQLPLIKAEGFNTVWLGGFSWKNLQSAPGVWNTDMLAALKAHLDLLQKNNMRAIFQLNYVGPGYAPQGIDGCNWMNDPAQVKKFDDFVSALGGQLSKYNYMIYYSVFTEQSAACLIARNQLDFYKGLHYYPDGSVVTATTTAEAAAQVTNVHAVNTMLKNSIGRLAKDLPPALRNQMFLGIHDALVSAGQITDATPASDPFDFDFFSIAFYPSYKEASVFPSDSTIGTGGAGSSAGSAAYSQVVGDLDTAVGRVRQFYQSAPLLLGEFGWWDFDQAANQPVLKKDSPSRNLAFQAMLDWSSARSIGSNMWAWLPRYLDDPTQDTPTENAQSLLVRDSNILTAAPTLTTVLDLAKAKFLGQASCTWNGGTISHGASVTAYQAASGSSCVSETRTCSNGTLSGSYVYASCTVSAPTTLSSSCSADGTTGTFSWPAANGAIGYYLNVYDTNAKQYVKGPNASATSPVTLATTPGHTYTSWIYVATSTGWSASIGASPFTCPAPTGTVLTSSCSSDGTQATFAWTLTNGATGYYLNVYDATAQQYVKGPNASATSPVTLATTPGHTYTSWVYAATSAGWSGANGAPPLKCVSP